MSQDKSKAPAVDSSIMILQLLVNSYYPLTLSEISEQTGIPVASCYRILNTLMDNQMVAHDPGRKKSYCIGSKIFQMASTIYNRQTIIPYFHPIAEILKNETHKSVLLSIPVGNKMVVVAKTESSLGAVFNTHVGQTLPMHRAASGKAIMSMRAAEYQKSYIDAELRASNGAGIDAQTLAGEMERAKRLGYAVTHGEIDSNVSCIAAPILDLRNEPIAAISVCVAGGQLRDHDVRTYSTHLIQAARQLSSRIG